MFNFEKYLEMHLNVLGKSMLTYDWTAKILYPLLTRSSLWWSWRNLIALEYLIFNVPTQTFCQPGFMEIWQLCLTEMIIFFRKVKGHGLLLQTCIFSSDPFAFWMLSRWITSNNWERGVRLGGRDCCKEGMNLCLWYLRTVSATSLSLNSCYSRKVR